MPATDTSNPPPPALRGPSIDIVKPTLPKLSPLVQEMVQADKSGVMFTVDPIRNRLDCMVIEGAPGLGEAIVSGGHRLQAEPALSTKVDDAAEAGARYVVGHFGGEITHLVSTTIARWDGEETSERLELLLGPDLQFIRINGTVVGGLAGLVIYTVAQLLG